MPLPWFLDEEAQKRKKRQKAAEAEAARAVGRRGAFDAEPEGASLPMRLWLAEQWNAMSTAEQEVVRARRGRRGIRCDGCGKIGVYREMCPNGCKNDAGTPDSQDFTPPPSPGKNVAGSPPKSPTVSSTGMGAGEKDVGLGILWGPMGFEDVPLEALGERIPGRKHKKEEDKPKHVKRKADLSHCREESQDVLAELTIADRQIKAHEFYTKAKEGYSRSLPELTLHQIMRKIMRTLHNSIQENVHNLEAKVDTTLLHPPVLPAAETFYPKEMGKMKEYTEFFARKMKRAERTDRLAYKFQGGVRPADGLDALFRGTGSATKDVERTLALYQSDPKAGESAHSKIGWKSNLAKNDLLAVADPAAAAKAIEVENLFKAQGAWTQKQKVDMEQRNDRFEHLVFILQKEMAAEHEREARELSGNAKAETKQAQMDVFLERLRSVDHLLKVLSLYKLSGPLEEGDMLFFQLRKWQETLRERVQARSRARSRRSKARGRARGGTAGAVDTEADDEQENEYDDGLGLEMLEEHAPKQSTKAGSIKTNSLIAKGENPYYEADVYIEKHKRLSKRLAKQGKFNINQAPRYLSNIKNPSPSPSRSPSPNRAHKLSTQSTGLVEREGSVATAGSEDDESSTSSIAIGGQGLDLVHSLANKEAVKARQLREDIKANTLLALKQVKDLKDEVARKTAHKRAAWRPKSFVNVYAKPQREIDEEVMAAAKTTFEEVDFGHHVRKGNRFDLAYLKPTLIPVPGAFIGDGKHTLNSYEGEKIVGRAQRALVSDLGYTPQKLLPLYVRNTLLEPNGTSASGDQTQEVMAMDRRYSHYMGRPLNRFEPGKELVDSKAFLKSSSGFGPNAQELAAKLAPIKAERAARAKTKRVEEMKYHPMNRSLVRVVFGLPIPNTNDVVFQPENS